jgi:monoamine oxidase
MLEAVGRRPDGALVCSVRDGARSRDLAASRVLLTLPFTMLRQVRLDVPVSPAKRLAIDAMGYGANAKLMIGFRQRAWRTQHRTNGSTMTDLPYQTTWETSRLQAGAAGILTNFTGGRQGLAVGSGTPEEQARHVVASLERVFPGIGAARGGAPAVRFHWPTNPWVRGSYAAFKPGQWTSINGAAGEPEGAVFFAGEHCSLDAQGFMEGGCETGAAAAAAILASLGRPGPAVAGSGDRASRTATYVRA